MLERSEFYGEGLNSMTEENNGPVENYLAEIQAALEIGIKSCQDEEDVRRYYQEVITSFINDGKVSSQGFGKAEIGEDYIALTFAYRPNIPYYHETDQAEQPRFIFKKDVRKAMSIEDMVAEVDKTMEELEGEEEPTEEEVFNEALSEIEDLLED